MPETDTAPVKADANGKLRRREPFAFLDDIEEEMERWFRRPSFAPPAFMRTFRRPFTTATAWAPRTDVYEKNGKLVVTAELPGLKKEDVTVEIDGEDLVIRGETKAETEVKEEDYYRIERNTGSFYRRMPLPAGTTPEQIDATLKDGVLEVHIRRPAEAKTTPTNVEVK
jgi:HSP20 family protein